MLNDIAFFANTEKQNASIASAKELFGGNVPYVIERTIDGRVVVFSDHFIRTSREAMSTGCMAKMNMSETNLWLRFVEYQNKKMFRDISDLSDEVLVTLSRFFVDEIYLLHHSEINECYDRPEHSWYEG